MTRDVHRAAKGHWAGMLTHCYAMHCLGVEVCKEKCGETAKANRRARAPEKFC